MSELEEINKGRIAAGLKPIPVPGSATADNGSGEDGMQVDEDPDVVAQRNYQEQMEQNKKEKETK